MWCYYQYLKWKHNRHEEEREERRRRRSQERRRIMGTSSNGPEPIPVVRYHHPRRGRNTPSTVTIPSFHASDNGTRDENNPINHTEQLFSSQISYTSMNNQLDVRTDNEFINQVIDREQ